MRRLERRDVVVAEEAYEEDDEEDEDDEGRGRFLLGIAQAVEEEAGHLWAVAEASFPHWRWGDDKPKAGGSFIAAPLGEEPRWAFGCARGGSVCGWVCMCIDCEERIR